MSRRDQARIAHLQSYVLMHRDLRVKPDRVVEVDTALVTYIRLCCWWWWS